MDPHATNKVGKWCLVVLESEWVMHVKRRSPCTTVDASDADTPMDAGTSTCMPCHGHTHQGEVTIAHLNHHSAPHHHTTMGDGNTWDHLGERYNLIQSHNNLTQISDPI